MRITAAVIFVMMLAGARTASAQSFELSGSAGPTLIDAGNSFAGGVGYSPNSRLTLFANVERTHLSTRTRRFEDGGFSSFRGGTMILGSAELRIAPFGRGRVGPYGLVGFAAGVSRPNVNEIFTTPVTNGVRGIFGGGGLLVPLSPRLTVFADARMLLGAEGTEGFLAVAPLRVGLSWRF